MNESTSSKQSTPEFWSGTQIVKSTNNAFTRKPGPSLMCTPQEQCKVTTARNKANRELQQPAGGHAVNGLRNLSKRGQRHVVPVRAAFCTPIEPAGAGIKRNAKTKASI